MGMKSAVILLTSLGLLAVPVLATDMPMDTTEPQWASVATLMPESTDATVLKSATVAVEVPLATPAYTTWKATVTWATWTATVARVSTGVATYTARAGSEPSSPLLDRLVKNKPSIWGNKGFYVLFGSLYLTLLGLFLKQILDTLKHLP